MRFIKLATIIAATFFVAMIAILGGRTLINNGDRAISEMDESERTILRKLDTIRRGMKLEEVVLVLGEPDEYGPLDLRPKWQVGDSPINARLLRAQRST